MKKFVLSFSVVVLFLFYSLIQRKEGIVAKPISAVIPSVGSTVNPSVVSSSQAFIPTSTVTSVPVASGYKDGSFIGDTADAYYGNIQVKAVIQGGKISDVQFLQYPNDRRTSIEINSQAMPILTQEAIQAQNAQVDIVSGATDSSQAFIQSLTSALSQAK